VSGHGTVLPGNSRARNRSRSRRRSAWKAPSRLRYLLWDLMEENHFESHVLSMVDGDRSKLLPEYRRFISGGRL
jgi:hypothetical protein